MDRINIGGVPHFLFNGEAEVFEKETFFGLNIGDKIIQVGLPKITKKNKSGITSSNRVDDYITPIEYAGTVLDAVNGEQEPGKALVFRVQAPDVTGLKAGQYLYTLYFLGHANSELLVPDLDNLSVRIYKPVFKKSQ